ncbi:unnamed protein product, partial [Gulo gulo]
PEPAPPAAGPLRSPPTAPWTSVSASSAFQSPACLVRPPVALMWARRGALPAKQWPPGRPDPRSGREKMLAVEQGARGARPQQALGACGGSTRKTHLGSRCKCWGTDLVFL